MKSAKKRLDTALKKNQELPDDWFGHETAGIGDLPSVKNKQDQLDREGFDDFNIVNTVHKKDIKYGKENLLAENEFDPKYGKERITILVDQQVIDAFREKAQKEGSKYQTLMGEALRECIFRK